LGVQRRPDASRGNQENEPERFHATSYRKSGSTACVQ